MNHPSPILIADDDPDIRDVIELALGAYGFRTLGAADGAEALAQARKHPGVGLILLDLMMPRLSGAETMRRLKSESGLSSIPVVILSGDNAACQVAHMLGASGCLRKPVDLENLLATVNKFVRP